jgi:hypothetical protein
MGYPHPNEKNMERLEKVLASKTLGLKDGGFDLKYSTPEFLVALSKVAGLNEQEVRQRIGNINQDVSDDWHAFKPYIWVDTHFKRTTQPIFALAALESRRHLGFRAVRWLHLLVPEYASHEPQSAYGAMLTIDILDVKGSMFFTP